MCRIGLKTMNSHKFLTFLKLFANIYNIQTFELIFVVSKLEIAFTKGHSILG